MLGEEAFSLATARGAQAVSGTKPISRLTFPDHDGQRLWFSCPFLDAFLLIEK